MEVIRLESMTSENGTVSLLVVKGLLQFHDRLTKITRPINAL